MKKIQSPLINKNIITTNNIIQEEESSEINKDLLYGIWDRIPIILNYQCGLKQMEKILKKPFLE